MNIYTKIVVFATLAISILSCLQKEEMPEKIKTFDNSTGLPLINSEVSLFSLQDKVTIMQVGANGIYEMVITPGWFSFPTADKLIKIPATFASVSPLSAIPLAAPAQAFSMPNTVIGLPISMNNSATFSVVGTSLKKIYFKAGTIDLSFLHTLNSRSAKPFTIEITNLLKADGTATTLTIGDANTNINANALQVLSSSLAGYYLDITSGYKLDIKLNATFSAGTPTNGSFSLGGINFTGVQWSKLEADLNNENIPVLNVNNQQEIDFFALTPFKSNVSNNDPNKTTVTGLDFYFEGASVKLDIKNGFGIPLKYDISPLKTLRKDGTDLQVFNDNQLQNLQLSSARDNGSPAKSVNGFLSSNNTMSITGNVMNDLLRYGPTKLGYGLSLKSQPTRPAVTDFIYDTSSIKVYPEVRIPFKGYFKLYDIEETAKYPLSSKDTTTTFTQGDFSFDINRGAFGVKIDNKLPMKFFISVYFTEEDSSKLIVYQPAGLPKDTVKLGPFVVEGATVDANGRVNGSSIFQKVFLINKEKFVLINKKCKKIRIVGRPETTGYADGKKIVQITPDNKMGIKINLIADYTVSQK